MKRATMLTHEQTARLIGFEYQIIDVDEQNRWVWQIN